MTKYNLREASKHGVPEPRDGYEQRKVLYKKYNAALIKGWSKRVDDGVEYFDKDFVLCERLIVVEKDDNNTFLATTPNVPEAVGVGDTPEEATADLEVAVEIVAEIKKKRVGKLKDD